MDHPGASSAPVAKTDPIVHKIIEMIKKIPSDISEDKFKERLAMIARLAFNESRDIGQGRLSFEQAQKLTDYWRVDAKTIRMKFVNLRNEWIKVISTQSAESEQGRQIKTVMEDVFESSDEFHCGLPQEEFDSFRELIVDDVYVALSEKLNIDFSEENQYRTQKWHLASYLGYSMDELAKQIGNSAIDIRSPETHKSDEQLASSTVKQSNSSEQEHEEHMTAIDEAEDIGPVKAEHKVALDLDSISNEQSSKREESGDRLLEEGENKEDNKGGKKGKDFEISAEPEKLKSVKEAKQEEPAPLVQSNEREVNRISPVISRAASPQQESTEEPMETEDMQKEDLMTALIEEQSNEPEVNEITFLEPQPPAKRDPEKKSMEPTNDLDDINPVTSQPLETQHDQLEGVIIFERNQKLEGPSSVLLEALAPLEISKHVKNVNESKKMEPKPMMQSNEPKVNGMSPGTSRAASPQQESTEKPMETKDVQKEELMTALIQDQKNEPEVNGINHTEPQPSAGKEPEQKPMEPTNNLDDINPVTSHEPIMQCNEPEINGSSPVISRAASPQNRPVEEPMKTETMQKEEPMTALIEEQNNEPEVNGICQGTSRALSPQQEPKEEPMETEDNGEEDSATKSADLREVVDKLVSTVLFKFTQFHKLTPEVRRERERMVFRQLYEKLMDKSVEGQLAPKQRARITKETNMSETEISEILSEIKEEIGSFDGPMSPDELTIHEIYLGTDFKEPTYDKSEEQLNKVREKALELFYQNIISQNHEPILGSKTRKRLACRLGFNLKKLDEKWDRMCAMHAVPVEAEAERSEQRYDVGELGEPELDREPNAMKPINEPEENIETEIIDITVASDRIVHIMMDDFKTIPSDLTNHQRNERLSLIIRRAISILMKHGQNGLTVAQKRYVAHCWDRSESSIAVKVSRFQALWKAVNEETPTYVGEDEKLSYILENEAKKIEDFHCGLPQEKFETLRTKIIRQIYYAATQDLQINICDVNSFLVPKWWMTVYMGLDMKTLATALNDARAWCFENLGINPISGNPKPVFRNLDDEIKDPIVLKMIENVKKISIEISKSEFGNRIFMIARLVFDSLVKDGRSGTINNKQASALMPWGVSGAELKRVFLQTRLQWFDVEKEVPVNSGKEGQVTQIINDVIARNDQFHCGLPQEKFEALRDKIITDIYIAITQELKIDITNSKTYLRQKWPLTVYLGCNMRQLTFKFVTARIRCSQHMKMNPIVNTDPPTAKRARIEEIAANDQEDVGNAPPNEPVLGPWTKRHSDKDAIDRVVDKMGVNIGKISASLSDIHYEKRLHMIVRLAFDEIMKVTKNGQINKTQIETMAQYLQLTLTSTQKILDDIRQEWVDANGLRANTTEDEQIEAVLQNVYANHRQFHCGLSQEELELLQKQILKDACTDIYTKLKINFCIVTSHLKQKWSVASNLGYTTNQLFEQLIELQFHVEKLKKNAIDIVVDKMGVSIGKIPVGLSNIQHEDRLCMIFRLAFDELMKLIKHESINSPVEEMAKHMKIPVALMRKKIGDLRQEWAGANRMRANINRDEQVEVLLRNVYANHEEFHCGLPQKEFESLRKEILKDICSVIYKKLKINFCTVSTHPKQKWQVASYLGYNTNQFVDELLKYQSHVDELKLSEPLYLPDKPGPWILSNTYSTDAEPISEQSILILNRIFSEASSSMNNFPSELTPDQLSKRQILVLYRAFERMVESDIQGVLLEKERERLYSKFAVGEMKVAEHFKQFRAHWVMWKQMGKHETTRDLLDNETVISRSKSYYLQLNCGRSEQQFIAERNKMLEVIFYKINRKGNELKLNYHQKQHLTYHLGFDNLNQLVNQLDLVNPRKWGPHVFIDTKNKVYKIRRKCQVKVQSSGN